MALVYTNKLNQPVTTTAQASVTNNVSWVAGGFYVLTVSINASTVSVVSLSSPAGIVWHQQIQAQLGSSQWSAIYYGVATQTTTATLTINKSGSTACGCLIDEILGVDPINPIVEAYPITVTSTTNTLTLANPIHYVTRQVGANVPITNEGGWWVTGIEATYNTSRIQSSYNFGIADLSAMATTTTSQVHRSWGVSLRQGSVAPPVSSNGCVMIIGA